MKIVLFLMFLFAFQSCDYYDLGSMGPIKPPTNKIDTTNSIKISSNEDVDSISDIKTIFSKPDTTKCDSI